MHCSPSPPSPGSSMVGFAAALGRLFSLSPPPPLQSRGSSWSSRLGVVVLHIRPCCSCCCNLLLPPPLLWMTAPQVLAAHPYPLPQHRLADFFLVSSFAQTACPSPLLSDRQLPLAGLLLPPPIPASPWPPSLFLDSSYSRLFIQGPSCSVFP